MKALKWDILEAQECGYVFPNKTKITELKLFQINTWLIPVNLPKLFWPGFLAKLNVNWYKSLNLPLSLRSASRLGSLLRSLSMESQLH